VYRYTMSKQSDDTGPWRRMCTGYTMSKQSDMLGPRLHQVGDGPQVQVVWLSHEVGPGRHCSPRHRMSFIKNEGSKCVSMTWLGISARPYHEDVILLNLRALFEKLRKSVGPRQHHKLGPGRCCSPHHRMLYNSRYESSKCVR